MNSRSASDAIPLRLGSDRAVEGVEPLEHRPHARAAHPAPPRPAQPHAPAVWFSYHDFDLDCSPVIRVIEECIDCVRWVRLLRCVVVGQGSSSGRGSSTPPPAMGLTIPRHGPSPPAGRPARLLRRRRPRRVQQDEGQLVAVGGPRVTHLILLLQGEGLGGGELLAAVACGGGLKGVRRAHNPPQSTWSKQDDFMPTRAVWLAPPLFLTCSSSDCIQAW
jgi:hypothetical protein